MAKKPYIIALEEHYQDPEVKQLGAGPGAGRDIVERLDDLSALRIRGMDEAGIDLQVLSHSIPGLQAVDAEAVKGRSICATTRDFRRRNSIARCGCPRMEPPGCRLRLRLIPPRSQTRPMRWLLPSVLSSSRISPPGHRMAGST
jgi:hypothetical protein